MSLAHAMVPSLKRATKVLYGVSLLKLTNEARDLVEVQTFHFGREHGYFVRVFGPDAEGTKVWAFAEQCGPSAPTSDRMVLYRGSMLDFDHTNIPLEGARTMAETFRSDAKLSKAVQREIYARAREVAKYVEQSRRNRALRMEGSPS